MWKQCCAALGVLLLPVCILAQTVTPLQLDKEHDEFVLAGRLQRLEDPGARMTRAEARAAQDWALLPDMPDTGFTRSAIWLRLTVVQPPDGKPEWRLSIDDTLLDEAQLHVSRPDGHWEVQRAGHSVARAEWPLDSRIPTFRLRLTPGQHELYLRLQSEHALSLPIRLHSVNGYMRQDSLAALAFGAYFGVFAIVILLQLAFWLVGREAVTGWYLLYTSVLLTVTLLRSGYPQMAPALTGQLSKPLLLLSMSLAPLAIIHLSAVWLQLNRHLPRLNVLFQGSAYVTGLLATGVALTHDPTLGLKISQAVNFSMVAMVLGVATWLWRRKLGEAGYYLLIFGAIDLGLLVRLIRNLGFLPVNFFTDYALYIGTVVHLMLMSLYSIRRYNKLHASLESEQRARVEQRDFVGMVSHEFRTPLAIINTSIQQLTANLDAPVEKTLKRAGHIRDAVQRMNLLLDVYLSLDRMDSAQHTLQLRPCDFYEVLEDAASDWPVNRIRMVVQQLPAKFVCDPDLMRIVLRNLLANAVRHTPENSTIELEARGEDGRLHIRVQDWGEGIPEQELPRMFQRYFRGRSSQGKPGAGLGLHLVQRIVQAHGGTITVQSTVGQGTTFLIVLPPGQLPRS